MLSRKNDCINSLRAVLVIVFNRDLALRVGSEIVDLSALEMAAMRFNQLMRKANRRRHQLRRLIAGVAEHHSLVASALLLVEPFTFAHALRDIRALLAKGDLRCTTTSACRRRLRGTVFRERADSQGADKAQVSEKASPSTEQCPEEEGWVTAKADQPGDADYNVPALDEAEE